MKTKTPAPRAMKAAVIATPKLEVRAATAEEQGEGFCGMMSGTALPYGVKDAYDTVFVEGCLDRTRQGRVTGRKVKLFLDHSYGVRSHVGTILELNDVAGAAMMVAGLFDTEEGEEAKRYLSAVLASRSETGLSVGFYNRKSDIGQMGEDRVLFYHEIELEEISITPRQAVPGATVSGVRAGEGEDPETAERVFRILAESLPAERVTAIVAEVAALRGGDDPTAQAPATASDDKSSTDANASTRDQSTGTEDVPLSERRDILARAHSPS